MVTTGDWAYLFRQVLVDAGCNAEAFSVIEELLLLDLHLEPYQLHEHSSPERKHKCAAFLTL